MDRKQDTTVNSLKDECSQELVLVTEISNSYHTPSHISDSDKTSLSLVQFMYFSLKQY